MGCHTWTYVHIPSEANKWAQEYKDAFIEEMKEVPNYDDIVIPETIKLAKELMEMVKNTSIEDIPKLLEEKQKDARCYALMFECVSFGNYRLFKIHNGKIYRDNGIDSYYDMFRIHGDKVPSCYSLEETLKRCKEYYVDWNLRSKNGRLINNKKQVYEFWEKYPDSIIEFV